MDKKITSNTLVFGDRFATEHSESITLAYQLSKVVPSLQDIKFLHQSNKFIAKSCNVSINNLKMNAHILSPLQINSSQSDDMALMIPILGSCETKVEGKKYLWGENQFAYFKPRSSGVSLTKEIRQSVVINIVPEKLINQIKIMFGLDDDDTCYFDFDRPRLIPLAYKNISFAPLFFNLFYVLDEHYDKIEDLEKTKFDDLLYRSVVILLFPERFFCDIELKTKRLKDDSYSTLKLIEAIKDDSLIAFMTLTDLEKFVGLSTRSLQMVFKKYFGVTPSSFLRDQKLQFTRKLLLSNGNINVTNAALEMGFINFSQFAKYYRIKFGELPSHTRKLK